VVYNQASCKWGGRAGAGGAEQQRRGRGGGSELSQSTSPRTRCAPARVRGLLTHPCTTSPHRRRVKRTVKRIMRNLRTRALATVSTHGGFSVWPRGGGLVHACSNVHPSAVVEAGAVVNSSASIAEVSCSTPLLSALCSLFAECGCRSWKYCW
jgi:hypothetical protein